MIPGFLQRKAQRHNGAYFSTFSEGSRSQNRQERAESPRDISPGFTSAFHRSNEVQEGSYHSGAASHSRSYNRGGSPAQENVMKKLATEGIVPSTIEECWEEIRALREAMEILAESSMNSSISPARESFGLINGNPRPERLSEAQRKIRDLEKRNNALRDEKDMYSDLVQQLGGQESAKNLLSKLKANEIRHNNLVAKKNLEISRLRQEIAETKKKMTELQLHTDSEVKKAEAEVRLQRRKLKAHTVSRRLSLAPPPKSPSSSPPLSRQKRTKHPAGKGQVVGAGPSGRNGEFTQRPSAWEAVREQFVEPSYAAMQPLQNGGHEISPGSLYDIARDGYSNYQPGDCSRDNEQYTDQLVEFKQPARGGGDSAARSSASSYNDKRANSRSNRVEVAPQRFQENARGNPRDEVREASQAPFYNNGPSSQGPRAQPYLQQYVGRRQVRVYDEEERSSQLRHDDSPSPPPLLYHDDRYNARQEHMDKSENFRAMMKARIGRGKEAQARMELKTISQDDLLVSSRLGLGSILEARKPFTPSTNGIQEKRQKSPDHPPRRRPPPLPSSPTVDTSA